MRKAWATLPRWARASDADIAVASRRIGSRQLHLAIHHRAAPGGLSYRNSASEVQTRLARCAKRRAICPRLEAMSFHPENEAASTPNLAKIRGVSRRQSADLSEPGRFPHDVWSCELIPRHVAGDSNRPCGLRRRLLSQIAWKRGAIAGRSRGRCRGVVQT
jgi:hypothetical protein